MILLFACCCLVYLALLGGKAALALTYAAHDPLPQDLSLPRRTLTVAQAILSGDAALKDMLESNLKSLSGQRFLWLCDEDDAVGLSIARELMAAYPGEEIILEICPPCPPARNPKLFKLIHGTPRMDTPLVLVLDDDTHLPRASAAVLAQHAATHGIATGLPSYRNGRGLPSLLLAQFVNNNSVTTYLSLLPLLPPISINGMCYVIKAEHAGIFANIGHHLTDDLALAMAIKESGGSIYQSSYPQVIATEVADPAHYMRMMHRWYLFALLLLKRQPPGYQALICLLHGWHPLLLWGLLGFALAVPSWPLLGVASCFLGIRSAILIGLQRKFFKRVPHRFFASLFSELLQPWHLLHAVMVRRIDWRGRKYRVFESDRFESDE